MAILSVIVPVYNTEKYVERCLDSILNQTVKGKIELIVINDGSTDNSAQIIQDYIQKHPEASQIKYFEKENEGIAKTRNLGIEKATSPYILFVDSDDYIDNRLIEELEPYMKKEFELIKFKLQQVYKDCIVEKVEGPVFGPVTGETAFSRMFAEDKLLDSPCVYLIKKELFSKNNFQFQGTYHEDFGLIPILLLVAQSVISTKYYLYNYVQVENSITRNHNYQKTIQKMEDCLAHYDNMVATIEKFKIKKRAKQDIKIYYTNAILQKIKELEEKDQDRYINEMKKRKFSQNIKARNPKQLIKKILLKIDIKLYLKMR